MKTRKALIVLSATVISIVALTVVALTSFPVSDTSAHTSSQISQLNSLAISKNRNVWTSAYDTLRNTSAYSWMDWSGDFTTDLADVG